MAALTDEQRKLLNEFYKQIALAGLIRFPLPDLQFGDLIASDALFTNSNSVVPVSSGGATTIDWSLGCTFSHTLTENVTYSFSNTRDGQSIVVAVTNTASNFTVTWPSVKWVNGAPPVQTTGAKTDLYTFIKIGSTLLGTYTQNFS